MNSRVAGDYIEDILNAMLDIQEFVAEYSYDQFSKSLFNFFWFFFNFKTTTKFHPNLSKSIHSFKNVDSFTQAFTKIFQIVELFLWEFPTATAISHQV
ncbi:predicted protein [Methanosarcina acetivorans C2A]|uniref:Uncharacterized protein n=1 Tax=Methanosarcina acetivorans (strain ATCC 35395 / DSM 2834 / JCM 12185 / C2A) TaxID=188937 RepID=Q8TNB4_METAC|nr:predicted protein [Methanosarcina acetivorans C2A]